MHLSKIHEDIEIAQNEVVLRNDLYRITEFPEHFEALAHDFQPALNRLVRIRDTGKHQHLRQPPWFHQFISQKLRSVLLDQDPGFEIQSG